MKSQKKNDWKQIMIWAVIILILPTIWNSVFSKHNVTDVRNKIKNYLYQKYGEEFVVDRIGTRSSRGQAFYQARIYPKSILGTNKEWDEYYYSSASVIKKSFGRLGGVGDGYGKVKMNIKAEKYLMPKVKEIFGEKVKLKIDVKYKKREKSGYFVQYLEENFIQQLAKVNDDPENNKLELELDVYIFDRIEGKEEKKRRKKEIFEFVQYLKEVGLFKYLELVIKIVDERLLTSSYQKYRKRFKYGPKQNDNVNGVNVELPSRKLIVESSKILGLELKESKEKELVKRMNEIEKSELGIDGIEGYLEQYFIRICSIKMMKTQPYGEYEEEKEKGTLNKHRYLKIDDIELGKENLIYIYRIQGGLKDE